MIDLKLTYTKQNGKNVSCKFNTIMDFTDSYEEGTLPSEILSSNGVDAIFFEKESRKLHFDTIKELYDHSIAIMR